MCQCTLENLYKTCFCSTALQCVYKSKWLVWWTDWVTCWLCDWLIDRCWTALPQPHLDDHWQVRVGQVNYFPTQRDLIHDEVRVSVTHKPNKACHCKFWLCLTLSENRGPSEMMSVKHTNQTKHVTSLQVLSVSRINNNNYLFYIAPQQQLYELLALYRSTNAIKRTSICYLN